MNSTTVTFSYNPHYKALPGPEDTSGHTMLTTMGTDSETNSETQHLLKTLDEYKTVSAEEETKWLEASLEIVGVLREWRKRYKQLDQRKRQLKKEQRRAESEVSSQEKEKEHTTSTEETSMNDKSEEDGDEEDESDRAKRPLKRRRMGL
ncbi:CYFA0S01e20032g1_1 [Cyberlindnera fabianii]|uniref:CYFA0S01e20032g1_1 n=1 Tax=Cyberlindnera fabianii TaxID=36022 RepID=A0A061ARP8_CYBFA|nr:CYFA0S01e20032g1_1 [Cyberlindnera fabianii]